MSATATTNRSPEVQAARNLLRQKGWSQVALAAHLGISRIHVTYVLNGHRVSRRVLDAIRLLPESNTPA